MKKILAVLALLLVVVAACGGTTEVVTNTENEDGVASSETHTTVNPTPSTPETETETKTPTTGEVKAFNVVAKNWEFIPAEIRVNAGDRVELTVTSMDVMHGFRLPDYAINERLPPNTPVKISFVADKKGTFPFSCSVPCGSGHGGMRGQLIVE